MKILKYINIGLLSLAAILMVVFYANLDDPNPNPMLYFAYILAGVAVVGLVGFYIYSLIERPKQIKFVALVLAGVVALTAVCYLVSTPTAVGLDPELERVTSSTAILWSEASIYGMYILFAGAFVSIIVSSVRNMFK